MPIVFCLFLFFLIGLYLLFIYFLSLAALGLCCCTRAFSSCGERASHCGGFSCCGAWTLGTQASVAVAHGLSSCGSVAVAHGSVVVGSRAQAQ